MTKKTIAVVGATGAQGGGLARAILDDPAGLDRAFEGAYGAFCERSGMLTTYLLTSLYWDNFIHFGMGPQPSQDGRLTPSHAP